MTTLAHARDQFFGLLELFEAFLGACDAFTILASTSVCRDWRETILASRTLRRHLSTIKPPRYLPNSPGTNGRNDREHGYRLSDSNDWPWCFRTPTPNGTLWVLRIPKANIETFVLIPPNPKRPMIRLGIDVCEKKLIGDRKAWRYTGSPKYHQEVVYTMNGRSYRILVGKGKQVQEGVPLPDLEWRARAGKCRPLCRTESKQANYWGNTLRDYFVAFYAHDFERLTGERLTFVTKSQRSMGQRMLFQ